MFRAALALLVAATVLAGCTAEDSISPTAIQKSYTDADYRAYNRVGGAEDTTKTVNVPVGAPKLTVKAIYEVGGASTFTLKTPAGTTVKSDDIAGSKELKDDQWYVTNNPLAGDWKLEIEIAGSGDYAFGFYY